MSRLNTVPVKSHFEMHSIIVIATLATVALAAPQNFREEYPIIPIVRSNFNGPINGLYDFDYETENGIRRQEQGSPSGANGAVVSQGGWTFTFPDGTPAEFNFVADEGGYRVQSDLLPVAPEMPAHAIEQIRRAEEERAAGIRWDQRGFRINK